MEMCRKERHNVKAPKYWNGRIKCRQSVVGQKIKTSPNNSVQPLIYNKTNLNFGENYIRKVATVGDIHIFSADVKISGREYEINLNTDKKASVKVYNTGKDRKKIKELVYSNDEVNGKFEFISSLAGRYEIEVTFKEQVEYQISINYLDYYKAAGFEEGDYVVLFAVNPAETKPFIAQLFAGEYGILYPMFVDEDGHIDTDEAERFYHASVPALDKKTVLSIAVGFTPADPVIDIVDFIEGKDVITGDELNRWLLLACIVTPEIIDQGIKAYGKHADDIGELVKVVGRNSEELTNTRDALRAKRLAEAGVSDENMLRVIKENLTSSPKIQRKILKQTEFDYLSEAAKKKIISAIDECGIDVSKWSGKLDLGENLSQYITKAEWKAMDKYLQAGKDVERVMEGTSKTADFIVEGIKIEFKGLEVGTYEKVLQKANKLSKEAFEEGGKGADKLVLDVVTNGQDFKFEDAKKIVAIMKEKYPDKSIEIWTKYGDAIG